jgi:hypothetical protein
MQTRRIASPLSVVSLSLLAGGLVVGSFVAGRVSADQPHMRRALEHLRIARTELDKAEADKGGHRARAMDMVGHAIDEVEQGMEFDRHHERRR